MFNPLLPLTLCRWADGQFTVCFVAFLFHEIVHPITFYEPTTQSMRYEFLPLMLISVVAAVQLIFCWLHSFRILLRDSNQNGTEDAN